MKFREIIALVFLTVFMFLTVIPIVSSSEKAFNEVMEEYEICDKCGYKAYYGLLCGHCGFTEE